MNFPKAYNLKYIILLLLFSLSLFAGENIMAYSANKYASVSRLSSGHWVKIKVSTTGVQYISNSQLSQMGFKDPSKVNVFGYGGAIISEVLSEKMPDDLPLLPVARSQNGISFFGTDHFLWQQNNASGISHWTHQQNPYSEESIYFLSDIDIPKTEWQTFDCTTDEYSNFSAVKTFKCRMVHEQDIYAPADMGRKLFGEDFRSPNTRSFSFNLTDNAEGNATAKVTFGHNTTSNASLKVSSNGSTTSGGTSSLSANTSSSIFMRNTTSQHSFSNVGDKLDLTLSFSGGGTVTMARLDHIEVEYDRKLKLANGQLHLYDKATSMRFYEVEGCDASVKVWDITDPLDIYEVKYSLKGDKLSFKATGFKEYIIFKPGTGYSVSTIGTVTNQNIHGLETPDMVIISPKEFSEAANAIAEMRRRVDGYVVHVFNPLQVYNEFSSGSADVSAFRKMLKMWHDRGDDSGHSIKYCLLMGKPHYDNKQVTDKGKNLGYQVIPQWQTENEATESSSYGCDDFIGMLEDGKSAFSISSSRIDVAVGRFPVATSAEAMQAARKLINYVENPELGEWRNNVLIIADDQDNAVHMKQAEKVYEFIRGEGNGKHFSYERLYFDAYPLEFSSLGPAYIQPRERMMQKLDEGVILVDYIGHANPYSWSHEHVLSWEDILSFNNKRLPLLYGATCEFARWDGDFRSGAEELWLNANGGYIAVLAATRTVYITNNGTLNNCFAKSVFGRDEQGKPKTFGQIMIETKNGYMPDSNKLRYAYLGDPALRIPSPVYEVRLDKINDTDMAALTSTDKFPEIKAREKVMLSGSVIAPDGSEATDFNGTLKINLYDAEKVITTYGNGEDGEEYSYNDHKTRLYTGATVVKNGKWSTSFTMPPELTNNYSPARLIFYASSEEKQEANGSSEQFFAYGYDNSAPEDTKGPDINSFYINHPDFTNGGVSGTTAMVMASFADESGINLSDFGIGHKLTLSLDGKKYFDDVNLYYTPDPFDNNAGNVAYPLSDITPGEHTLTLTVWDNANNSSSSSLVFNVSVSKAPEINNLSVNRSPAKTDVSFKIATDMPLNKVNCLLEVIDLQGRVVWSTETDSPTGTDSGISIFWNLIDKGGVRVDRGIYLYRATLTTPEGTKTTGTSRFAVAAP